MAWFNRSRGNGQRAATSRRRVDKWRPMVEALEERTLLTLYTCTVNTTSDSASGSVNFSTHHHTGGLRYCINQANSTQTYDVDTILFSTTGTFQVDSALPAIAANVTIYAASGPANVNVHRNTSGEYRLFAINSGVTATIEGLTVSNGKYSLGGGIHNAGTLTLLNTVVTENTALPAENPDDVGFGNRWGSLGGGIYNADDATLTIENGSKITNNTVVGDDEDEDHLQFFQGAGLYNAGDATLTISGTNSVDIKITGNVICPDEPDISVPSPNDCNPMEIGGNDSLFYEGGGIFNKGNTGESNVNIAFATIANNSVYAWITNEANGYSAHGGGVMHPGSDGSLLIENSTISGNYVFMQEAEDWDVDNLVRRAAGGGMNSGHGAIIRNSTIASNTIELNSENSGMNSQTFASGGGWHGKPSGAGQTVFQWCTITKNEIITEFTPSAPSGGGGIGVSVVQNVEGPKVYNSIVAENISDAGGTDVRNSVDVESSDNLIGDGDGSNFGDLDDENLVGSSSGSGVKDPGLDNDGLLNNGGSTETIELDCGSEAIDAGDTDLHYEPPYDQRGSGYDRSVDVIDIGAIEAQTDPCSAAPSGGIGGFTAVLGTANTKVAQKPTTGTVSHLVSQPTSFGRHDEATQGIATVPLVQLPFARRIVALTSHADNPIDAIWAEEANSVLA